MWSDDLIQKIWNKATKVEGFNESKYRKDACGAWIARDKYGTDHQFGWEVDHIYPLSKGGDDDLLNLRPLHYENNRSKADNYPLYKAAITSQGTQNITTEKLVSVNADMQQQLKKRYGK